VFVELQIAETAPRLVVGHPRRCEVETKRTTDGRPRVSVCDIGMSQVRVGLPDRLVERSDPAISAGHPRSGDYRGASNTSTVGHLPVVLAADQLTQIAWRSTGRLP